MIKETHRARRVIVVVVIAVPLCLAGLALWRRERQQALRPPVQPGVERITQITSDGLPKKNLVSDGSRLYFNETSASGQVLVQIDPAAVNPATVILPPSLANANILDVSRESELLVSIAHPPCAAIWVIAASGASPHRLGDLSAQAAAFAPDG